MKKLKLRCVGNLAQVHRKKGAKSSPSSSAPPRVLSSSGTWAGPQSPSVGLLSVLAFALFNILVLCLWPLTGKL